MTLRNGGGYKGLAVEAQGVAPDLTDQDKILLVFDYLGPLAFVSLVASRREFVRWHAKQGLLFSASVVALYLIMKILHIVLRRILWPVFGELFWALAALVWLGMSLVFVVCLVRALEGERFKIPLLGDLADLM